MCTNHAHIANTTLIQKKKAQAPPPPEGKMDKKRNQRAEIK
jgi:hypothetical protein